MQAVARPSVTASRIATSALAPFGPMAIGLAGKAVTPVSGVLDPLVIGGFFAIPVVGGLMIRLLGAWSTFRWTIALVAVATATMLAAAFWGSVNQACLEVPKVLWLAIPAALLAGWVVAVGAITAAVAQPTGSRRRAVVAFLAGAVLTVPLLVAALLLWNLLPDLPTVPDCEVMHIL